MKNWLFFSACLVFAQKYLLVEPYHLPRLLARKCSLFNAPVFAKKGKSLISADKLAAILEADRAAEEAISPSLASVVGKGNKLIPNLFVDDVKKKKKKKNNKRVHGENSDSHFSAEEEEEEVAPPLPQKTLSKPLSSRVRFSDGEQPNFAMLGLESVSLIYGDQPVITAASFSAATGERLGIVGPNGVGKVCNSIYLYRSPF